MATKISELGRLSGDQYYLVTRALVCQLMLQENRNRRILEQLEEQKKRLRQQSNPPPPPPPIPPPPPSGAPPPPPPPSGLPTSLVEQQHMTPQQRTALQHAHQNSVGYFITQDSSFGNLILPVIPRFDKV